MIISSVGTSEGDAAIPAFEYDAFISYRRQDGGWHARTLRHRLLDVRIPAGLTGALPGRRLRIYLDQIYERATEDFFENTIKPALRASRHLVIVQSPSATEPLRDGSPNWLEREIECFRSLPPEGRSISVAITSGDPGGPLPARLHDTHPNIERIDLRRWRRYKWAGFDDHVLTLAATLHQISPGDMPLLRREDARRHATQRRRLTLAAAMAGLIVLGASAAALWQSANARAALRRRNVAIAASLWDRLDFADMSSLTDDELNALWVIASGDRIVRNEFLAQMTLEPLRVARLGRGSAPILRALFLRWPPDRAEVTYQAVLKTVGNTTDRDRLAAVALALDGLARTLTPEQAHAAFDPLVQTIRSTTDDDQLATFATAVQALAEQLTPDQAEQAFPIVFDAMSGTESEAQYARLGWTAQLVANRLDARQVQMFFPRVLKALEMSVDDSDRMAALALAVKGMADRSAPDEARAALTLLVKGMDGAYADALAGLVPAVESLSEHASSGQARAAFAAILKGAEVPNADEELFKTLGSAAMMLAPRLTPSDAVAVFRTLLTVITGTTNSEELDAIEAPASLVATRMPADDAADFFLMVFQRVSGTTNDAQLEALGMIAGGLAKQVTAEWASRLFIAAFIKIQDLSGQQAIALALPLRALANQSTPGDANTTFPDVLDAIKQQNDSYRVAALGFAAEGVAGRMNTEDSRASFPGLLGAIRTATSGARIGAFGSAVRGLGARVTPEQADAAFPVILNAITKTVNSAEVSALGGAAHVLAGALPDQSAPTMLSSVLNVINDPGTSINQLSALAPVVDALVERVSQRDAALAFRPMLKVVSGTGTADHLDVFQKVVERKGGLSAAETQELQSELAWAPGPAMAAIWAEGLVRAAPRQPSERFAAVIVAALKSPPAAGPATSVLLDGLRAAIPGAPGAGAGLATNLRWIAATFPALDLDAAPVCPAPPRTGVSCP